MKVSVIMGSDSDLPVVEKTVKLLDFFKIPREVRVLSAHRTPYQVLSYVEDAEKSGIEVIIGAAGKAAHLCGVIASVTTLPVIGLPIKSSTMDGLDSLLSMVQMPKGVPVACVAIDGAENAAILAAQILAIKYPEIKERLKAFKLNMQKEVEEKDRSIKI